MSIPIPLSQNDKEDIPLKDISLGVLSDDSNNQREKNSKEQPTIIKNNPLLFNLDPNYVLTENDINTIFNGIQIKVTSENFIEGYPPFTKTSGYLSKISRVHLYLYSLKEEEKPSISEIKYKIIPEDFLGQLMTLHRELSPISYDVVYFKKYLVKHTHFAIGAFITIKNEEFLIGYILGELCTEKRFRQNAPNVLRNVGCCQKVKNFLFKSSSDKFAYIANLGVVNEYRKKKVGSELVKSFIEQVKQKDVVAIYTHVIEHNCEGIKFFESISWNYGGVVFSFYNFEHNYFDGQVFYTVLSNQNEFTEAEIRGFNEPKIDRTPIWLKVWRMVVKEVTT